MSSGPYPGIDFGGGEFRNSPKMLGGVKIKARGKKPAAGVKNFLTPILSYMRVLAKKFNLQKKISWRGKLRYQYVKDFIGLNNMRDDRSLEICDVILNRVF